MRRLVPCFVLSALMVAVAGPAEAQQPARPTPSYIDLPIPGHRIPCNIADWRGNFSCLRTEYDREENRVVFLLQTQRKFSFTDDGFANNLRFIDEDGVNLVDGKNLKFANDITKLRVGDTTRLYLTLPEEDVLQRTKKCEVVNKGFFTDPDKEKKNPNKKRP